MSHGSATARYCLLWLGLTAVGCSERATVPSPTADIRDITAALTSDVAVLLTPAGDFPSGVARSVDGRDVISPEEAKELALAYLRDFGPHVRDYINAQHGRPVDFGDLSTDARVLLAESPYGALPADAFSAFHKAYGPYYLVRVRSENRSLAVVAVSAYATDLRIVDGRLRTSGPYGNEFRLWVTPASGVERPAIGPEDAVRMVYTAFAERVSEVPRFIRAGVEFFPHLGAWRLRMAAPVRVMDANSGAEREVQELYLDAASGLFSIGESVANQRVVRFKSEGSVSERSAVVSVDVGWRGSLRTVRPLRRQSSPSSR